VRYLPHIPIRKELTMSKMKLKGSMVSKIPPQKLKKMKETLERMNKIREEFDMRLRDVITKEQQALEIEYKKLQNTLRSLEEQLKRINSQINDTKVEMVKLQAAYAALDKVLNEAASKKEEKVND